MARFSNCIEDVAYLCYALRLLMHSDLSPCSLHDAGFRQLTLHLSLHFVRTWMEATKFLLTLSLR